MSSSENLPASLDLESSLEWIRAQKFHSRSKLPSDAAVKVLRRMAASPHTRVRGAALRACRNIAAINPPYGVEQLNRNRVHLMTAKSLERESKFLEERMQALKLLRAMAQYSAEKVPRTLVRSLISIAAHRDDQLKEAALESIREYSLLNTRMVAECGGIAVMVNAILDPTMTHMADSLLLTLLHLLNQKDTRTWLRPALDLSALLAPFTSSDGALDGEEDRKIRRKLSRRAIVMMMRTWTGLTILASDPQGLRSLVQMLVQPVSYELRKDVLDTILEVFNTVNPLRVSSLGSAHSYPASTADGKKHMDADYDDDADNDVTGNGFYGAEPYMAEYWGVGPGAAGSKELAAGGFHAERVPGRHAHMHSLLDNFLVMVLLAFVQCGLVEALVELSVSSAPPMSRTATQLLSFVSRFSTRLLPGSVSRRLLSQKKLVTSAVDAARAGEVLDRARAQRAAHVIGLLSRIVGSGYDTALATLLSRSTYEDGVALASELALAGSLERAHLNLGVFPRSVIVSKLSVQELLTTAPKASFSQPSMDPTALPPPQRSNSSGGFVTKLKKMSRRLTATSSKGDVTPLVEVTADASGVEDQANLAAPLVANRGHRRLMQQLVLTDMAQVKKMTTVSGTVLTEDVKRLLDKARILIKIERREWTKWDWVAIDEILSGPCQTPQICAEVLKTKFFKRLSAFYSVASNGPFAQLPWEPDCVAYTNVATSMLRVLLNLPEAHEFLVDDRRGRLAGQISEALVKELNHAEDADGFERAQTVGAQTAGGVTTDRDGVSRAARLAKQHAAQHAQQHDEDDDEDDFDQTGFVGDRVFTSQACSTTMTREFFVLLGVFASSPKGVALLEQLGVFSTLNRLALHREKDYILRLAISHLDYSGPSAKQPREWLQLILMNNRVSLDLRHFAIGFFRSMLRSAQNQEKSVVQWILNLIFAQLKFQEVCSDALSVLIEASHYPMYLDIMVEMIEGTLRGEKNELTVHMGVLQRSTARRLLLKLLGSETGVKALKNLGWLKTIMDEWQQGEYLRYLHRVDSALLFQLLDQKKSDASWTKTSSLPKPIPVRAHEASALSEPGFTASELQWLFRMPWRIEVCAESSMGTIRVPMDAFIDCSQLRPESIFSNSEEEGVEGEDSVLRGICITAVPPWSRDKDVDKRQRARPFIVPEDATVYACLTLANQPIDRRGRTNPSPSGGGGFPFTSGGISSRGEASDSFGVAGAGGWENKFRSFAGGAKRQGTTRGGYSTMGRPSLQSEDLGMDEDQFGDAFAEAPGASPENDFVRPLSDDKFWVKCTPQARKSGLKSAQAKAANAQAFNLCPPNSAATFKFSSLDSQHRDSVTRDASKDTYERDSPAEITKSNEPEVRVVNPLLALRKDKKPSEVLNVDRSDLPPLLVLKEVRFYLDLVPQRFASPSIPVHLLGELAKTESGMDEIADVKLMERFLEKLRHNAAPSNERRSALWAIGHIGASEYGFARLHAVDPTFVKLVHQIALEASCLSLRGTACYTLGFFSRHRAGCLALHHVGWATLDSRSHPFATIAVPAKISSSPFHLPAARFTSIDVSAALNMPVDGVLNLDDYVPPMTVTGTDAQKVFAWVSDLSNHIAQKEAHSELTKMLSTNPLVFTDVRLYLAVHDLLARFNYELPVRQYILNMFHVRISFESEQTWQIIDSEPYH